MINALTTLNIEVVASLPTSNISSTTIYLKGSKQEGNNSYEEYIYVNGAWELIGTTEIDLTSYATKTYVDTKFDGITKSSLGLGNVENKSSATIRGEITSSNVTTALGFTPSKSDHTHSNYSYLVESIRIPTEANEEQYYRIFTVTPKASSYKDAHFVFDVVGRSRTLSTIFLSIATENDNYLKNITATYLGNSTLAGNIRICYYKDETNATSRIEVWIKVTSWNKLAFYPKTSYNIGTHVNINWDMTKGTAFPTDAASTITPSAQYWNGMSSSSSVTNSVNCVTIAANTDLNNVTTPGFHRCNQSSTVSTLTNCPVSSAFFMIVGQSAYTYQELVTYEENPKRYMRNKTGSSTWGAWKKVYTEADKQDTTLITDTRSANETPKWYLTNYKQQVVTEFKNRSAIGLPTTNSTFSKLTTYTCWKDSSGGYPMQEALSDNRMFIRVGTADDTWGAWSEIYTSSSKPTLSDLGVTATATELNYVDGVTSAIQTQLNNKAAKPITYTTTIPTSGWSSSAPYYVDITVTGITATDTPMIAPTYSGTLSTDQTRKENWNKIDRIVTSANKIRVYAFEEKPTATVPIQLTITR